MALHEPLVVISGVTQELPNGDGLENIASIEGGIVFNEQGADVDFRIEGDTAPNLFVVDAGGDGVSIGDTDADTIAEFYPALVRFNQARDDRDFVILGTSSTYAMLHVDAGDNSVKIGNAAGSVYIKPGAGVVFNDSGDPNQDFRVETDNRQFAIFVDASTDEVRLAPTLVNILASGAVVIDGSSVTVNDGGADADFRVEGDTKQYMIFVDASAATENIALVAGAAPNWQDMDGGLFIGDASTAPTGNPSGGVFVWSESGELKARDGEGNVTTLTDASGGGGAAGPPGGAFTIQYEFDDTTTAGDPSDGKLRLDDSTQKDSLHIYVDHLDVHGESWADALAFIEAASSSSIKGLLRLVSVDDPTKWIVFQVGGATQPLSVTYLDISVFAVAQSDDNPFSASDQLLLLFSPNGDAGTSFTWKGEWSDAAAYTANDVVEHDGSSYICVVSLSSGNEPPHVDWELLAAKGEKGDEGEPGEPGGGGGGTNYDVQIFTASDDWTKPEGAVTVHVTCIGGGGGGGSGRRGAAGSLRGGGGGGGGGGYSYDSFLAASLGDTETVTVGVGGAGGAGQTTNNTNGTAGSAGGNTSFGSHLTANGGAGGGAGTGSAHGSGGAGGSGAGTISETGGTGGDGGSNTSPSNVTGKLAGAGGGGGGGLTAGDANAGANAGASSAGTGGAFGLTVFNAVTGTLCSYPGSPGLGGATILALVRLAICGGGGGGGGATSTATAGIFQGFGGAGGLFGGGGGGSCATLNGLASTSRGGGDGGDGICVVVTELTA